MITVIDKIKIIMYNTDIQNKETTHRNKNIKAQKRRNDYEKI